MKVDTWNFMFFALIKTSQILVMLEKIQVREIIM